MSRSVFENAIRTIVSQLREMRDEDRMDDFLNTIHAAATTSDYLEQMEEFIDDATKMLEE